MSKIADMNDRFRIAVLTQPQENGKCVLTRGVATLPPETLRRVLEKIMRSNDFAPENDPYEEHDFGAVEVLGTEKVFWKIDYYADATLQHGAESKENAYRLLTIMFASEY